MSDQQTQEVAQQAQQASAPAIDESEHDPASSVTTTGEVFSSTIYSSESSGIGSEHLMPIPSRKRSRKQKKTSKPQTNIIIIGTWLSSCEKILIFVVKMLE